MGPTGMNHHVAEMQRGPMFKRRTVADCHLAIEVLWMLVYCMADTKDSREAELMVAGTFCLGVFASRLMIFAVDFFRVLAIPALLLMLMQLFPRIYIIGITIIYEEIDLTHVNPWNITILALGVVMIGHLWVTYEYGRAYYLIGWEKSEDRLDESCRQEADNIWKENQKIRKRIQRKKQRDQKMKVVERRALANGTLIEEDTPSTSTGQPSTSHDHYYIERD